MAFASAKASPICTVIFCAGRWHGLAMKADDIDVLDESDFAGGGGHGFRMRNGDRVLGLTEDAQARLALRQIDGLGQGLAQQAAFFTRIRPVTRRAERLYPLAVGFVDATSARRARCRSSDRSPSTSSPWCPRAPALPLTASLCRTEHIL